MGVNIPKPVPKNTRHSRGGRDPHAWLKIYGFPLRHQLSYQLSYQKRAGMTV